jgi:hypothetical protein
MQIREGAYYRTRDGAVVGPMQTRDESCYCWKSGTDCWTDKGEFEKGRQWEHDLISEVYVSDTPPDSPKGSMLKPQDWRRLKPIEPSPEAKTLRDEFAMAALTGLLANAVDDGSMGAEDWASDAYLFADKMMEARKK